MTDTKDTQIKPLNIESEFKKPIASDSFKKAKRKMILTFTLLIALGIGTGYGLFKITNPQTSTKDIKRTVDQEEITSGTVVGVKDSTVFRDTAEGKLLSGGIDGEGSHRLEREGGESQNVYLTSSVIDLDQFINRQVKVWGETFEGQKAGWLMDVGRLEVL